MVERLFLAVPRGCLQFVIVVFPDRTHLLFLKAFVASFFGIVMMAHVRIIIYKYIYHVMYTDKQ